MPNRLPLWTARRTQLVAAALELGAIGRDAGRVADLAIARATAERQGLFGPDLADAGGDSERALRALSTVALFPLPELGVASDVWSLLVDEAAWLAASIDDIGTFYDWSAASQTDDPGRKGRGAYSTPPQLSRVMAQQACRIECDQPPLICDPSAGHGALLLAALEELINSGLNPEVASKCLFGVELDPHARELCCLMLWLAGPGKSGTALEGLSERVVCGNALLGEWRRGSPDGAPMPLFEASSAPHAPPRFTWEGVFPAAFARGGFDVILMNPPWESLRHHTTDDPREAAARRAVRDRLSTKRSCGRGTLPPLYSVQGRGDRNLYKGFVELVPHLLREGGRSVALLPGAFASDLGMAPARALYLEHFSIERWTSFENLAGYFPIDGRYKFGILIADRSSRGTLRARFRFMAHQAGEVGKDALHVALGRRELAALGGPSAMFPEVSTRREADILISALGSGTRFFDPNGSFGALSYRREFDLTLDRDQHFSRVEDCRRVGYQPRSDGAWIRGQEVRVPLIEGRMIGAYDFFQKSWRSGSGRTARWTENDGIELAACQPQFLARPRNEEDHRIAICDVTSATNTRTMLAAWVPGSWPCGNTAPVLVGESASACLALLAVLNSMTFDWMLRRIAAGLHLNRFYLEAMPLPFVCDFEVSLLAQYAADHLRRDAHFEALTSPDREAVQRIASEEDILAATVEAVVARGYGLGADDLRHAFHPDSKDRKGLWRYYAATPAAVQIAEESIRALEEAA